MSSPISDLKQLIQSMEPILNEGVYVFASLPHQADTSVLKPMATILESEGITVVVSEEVALQNKIMPLFRAAWITLKVHSDLQAVGLTEAFAGALGKAGISCNVIAGAYHDHIFVPIERSNEAISALQSLQQNLG